MILAKELQELIDKLPDPNKHPELSIEYRMQHWPAPTAISWKETLPSEKRWISYVFVRKKMMGKQEWFFSHVENDQEKPTEKTDLQKFIELYQSLGINLKPKPDPRDNGDVYLKLEVGDHEKVVGYGFFTRIEFDSNGKFKEQYILE
jgi:hypothetical protein